MDQRSGAVGLHQQRPLWWVIGSTSSAWTAPHAARPGIPTTAAQIALGNCGGSHAEKAILDGGFLELVRFGIFSPGDTAIRETLEEYDSVIRVQTPKGSRLLPLQP